MTQFRSVFLLWLFAIASLGFAQNQQPKTTIKPAPIKPTAANDGATMFKQYCAACHGANAKGNGPATPALKSAPPDLTMLSKNNGGQFPAMHVAEILRGGANAPAHGSAEMPVWGPLFSSVSSQSQSVVELRISNISAYLESLQVK